MTCKILNAHVEAEHPVVSHTAVHKGSVLLARVCIFLTYLTEGTQCQAVAHCPEGLWLVVSDCI